MLQLEILLQQPRQLRFVVRVQGKGQLLLLCEHVQAVTYMWAQLAKLPA